MNMRPAAFEPDPFEIDPRPCELCGLTIDRHEMVDHGEGPLFFCADLLPDEMTLPELERRAELRRQEEVAEIMAGIFAKKTNVLAFCAMDRPAEIPPAYHPAASTIDAFWYVVRLDDPERLKAWLRDHPKDTPTLLKLLESK